MEGSSLFIMSAPHPSNPVHHYPELCSTCAARYQRHQTRRSSTWSEGSTDSAPNNEGANIEAQLAAEDTLSLAPPPPYTRRITHQRLDANPPSYRDIISSTPPPGAQTTTIQVTLRYTETLILEDDGYSKVVSPTARKYKAIIRIWDSMEWEEFWDCLRRIKPTVTMREGGPKDVRALRRKTKWERVTGTRMLGVRLRQTNWEETRHSICSEEMDKIVIYM